MYKVMIVDDEPVILDGLRLVVQWEEFGLKIAGEARNGLSALELLSQSKFHILITDIRMPEMDGLELIRKARKIDRNLKIIILSGYNDFEQVRDAAKLGIENYLLKPVDEEELASTLVDTVNKIDNELTLAIDSQNPSSILKQNILNRWAAGSISNRELEHRADILKLSLDSNFYIVSAIKIIGYCADQPAVSGWHGQETEQAFFAAISMCNEILASDWKMDIFRNERNHIVMIMQSNAVIPADVLKASLASCLLRIHDRVRLDLFASVGNAVDEAAKVSESYQSALNLLDYSIVARSNSVCSFDEIFVHTGLMDSDISPEFDKLRSCILALDNEEACLVLDAIYDRLVQYSQTTPQLLKNITTEILLVISNVSPSIKAEFWYGNGPVQKIIGGFSQITTIRELKDAVKNVACLAMERLSSMKSSMHPMVTRLIRYIEDNYMKEFSLKTLSESLNINPIYLGQLFKNETGEVFSNYINKYRIGKAKELLQGSNITIADISGRTGYQNPSYFISIFKKLTGLSPAEYRVKYKE